MKKIVIVQVEIPVEYDESVEKDLLEDLKEHFNRKYSKTSKFSCGTNGNYSWKYPDKNAKVIDII